MCKGTWYAGPGFFSMRSKHLYSSGFNAIGLICDILKEVEKDEKELMIAVALSIVHASTYCAVIAE